MKNFSIAFLAALLAVGVSLLAYETYRGDQGRKGLYEAVRTKQVLINAAHLAKGFSSLSQLRPHIETFWHETGSLPCRAEDLDLPTEILALQNRSLHKIALTGCGELEATYTELSGLDGGRLALRAHEVAAASQRGLVWECVTSDYPGIELSIASCSYQPRVDEATPPS